MSNPDDNVSTSELPGLVNVSAATVPPSISTLVPPRAPSPSHVTTSGSTSTSSSTSTNMDPDFHALYTALGSNPLLKTALPAIPKLAGVDNYTDWSNKIIRVFNLCKVTKILTGKWAEPTIKPKDTASEQNVEAWHALDSWIASKPSSLSPDFHCHSGLKPSSTPSTPRTAHQLLQSNTRLLTKYSGVRNPTSVTFVFSVPSATSTTTLQCGENSTRVLSLPYSLAIPLLLRCGGTTFLLGTRRELRTILSLTNEFGALFSITTLRGS